MLRKNNIPDLIELFRADPDRGRRFRLRAPGWVLDYSGLPLGEQERLALFELARTHALDSAVSQLFTGSEVNPSEHRPALHMALRASQPDQFQGVGAEMSRQRNHFIDLAGQLHQGAAGLTDLIHIGIGGSDLGPRLVADALDADDGRVRVHWLSTQDGRRFEHLIRSLDPNRTGVMIASKSFSTEETMTQAAAARQWLGQGFSARAWAATASRERAVEFGLLPDSVLTFPDWVGGRYSLWSSVGFSAAAQIGAERFRALLAGAARADADFHQAPDQAGLAGMMALLMHFLRRDLDLSTLGVIAYEPRLALLGDYLQQLVMESLGKGVALDDQPLVQPTSPLIFSGRGTDFQHSIFQALHQGLDAHPLILVGSLSDGHDRPAWHRSQLAHLLAQAAVFTRGRSDGRACQHMPGRRPVAVLLTERLTPEALGYLLASFEHAVFALSVIWGINPFDQWGVEEGKRLAGEFSRLLPNRPADIDEVLDLLARSRASKE